MLSASWYPMPAVHALLDTLLAGLSAAECRQLAREGGMTPPSRNSIEASPQTPKLDRGPVQWLAVLLL